MSNFKADPIQGEITPTPEALRPDGVVRVYASDIEAWQYLYDMATLRLKSSVEVMESSRDHFNKIQAIRPKTTVYLCRRGINTQGKWIATNAYDEIDQKNEAVNQLNFCRAYASAEFEWSLIGRNEYIELQMLGVKAAQ